MAGIINSEIQGPADPTAAPPAAPAGISDPLLAKTKAGIEAKVNPALKRQFLQIETACLALVTQGNMPSMILKKLQGAPDMSGAVSDGVANVMAMVFNEVSSKMAPQQKTAFMTSFAAAAPTASLAVMCQVLNMAEQSLKTQITPALIAQCSQETTTKVLGKLHISQEQIQHVISANQTKGA